MIKNQFYNKSECLITEGTLDFIFRTISLRKLVQRFESHKIYQDQSVLQKYECCENRKSMDHISRLNELVQPRPLRIHLTDLSLQAQLLFPLVMNSIIDIIFCCFLIIFSSWLLSIITNSIFSCNNNDHLLLIIISISLLSSLGKIILILSWLSSVLLTSSVPEKKLVYPPDF